jgi:hypothetical protein
MFHTTPNNEASTDRDDPVILGGSHGCIHVKPLDRDKLHQAGAFNRGTDLIIYSYEDVVPDDLK